MNKKDQVGIFGLNYENNLENFYISALKKLKYKQTGDLKKDAKWYLSNMKRYLPGIAKDMK